jgi:DnaJ-class molecular chaperone
MALNGKPPNKTFYDLLGIAPTATDAMIKKAYKVQALRLHPDKAGNSVEATQAFTRMAEAYNVLKDADKRRIYDSYGEQAVRISEDMNNATPDAMIEAFLQITFGQKLCLLIMLGTLIGVLLMFPRKLPARRTFTHCKMPS